MEKIFINGSIVSLDQARISVLDRGFLYGDGLFETMRAYGGEILRMKEHMERLFQGAKEIGLALPYKREELGNAIKRILKMNRLSEAYIRLTVTRGISEPGLVSRSRSLPTLVIVAKEFKALSSSEYRKGWKAIVVETRQNQASPLSRIKSLNFLNNILARIEAEEKRCDEGILLNTLGEVSEGSTSNIFLVKKDNLITPEEESGLLPGITRGIVVELAPNQGLKVYNRRVALDELFAADEVFLTSTLIEVMALVEVDGKQIGNGKPGKVTKKIHKAYRDLVGKEVGRQV